MTMSNTLRRKHGTLLTDSRKRRFASEAFRYFNAGFQAGLRHGIPIDGSGDNYPIPSDVFPHPVAEEPWSSAPPVSQTHPIPLQGSLAIKGEEVSIDLVGIGVMLSWRPPGPVSQLNHVDELIEHLRAYGRHLVADRIQQFLVIRNEDPDEPPIVIESLRSLVGFILQERRLIPPVIGSDPSGLMELEWHLADNGDPNSIWGRGNGVVSMRFLRSGNIQYVALSGPKRRGQERLRIIGEATKREMIAKLDAFAQRVIL